MSNDRNVRVTNTDGDVIVVANNTFNITMSEKAGEAVERFVRIPLRTEGIESLEIEANDAAPVRIHSTDADSFVPLDGTVAISDNMIRQTLMLHGPEFEKGAKWRFSDGTSTFVAEMLDKAFQDRVDGGERFGKGDLLDVQMRVVQRRDGKNRISAERSISHVYDHLPPPHQQRLPHH